MTSAQLGPTEEIGKHWKYFWTFARFQVQDTVFQFPIHPFVSGSITFARQFNLIVETPGSNDRIEVTGCPTVVLNVEVKDFEALLKVLIPSVTHKLDMGKSGDSPWSPEVAELDLNEWYSVLRLSTLWSFSWLRTVAIHQIQPSRLSALDRMITEEEWVSVTIDTILMARKYKIPSWLKKCYEGLVAAVIKHRPLTPEEAGRIGRDTAYELQHLALEQIQLAKTGKDSNSSECIQRSSLLSAELEALEKEDK